MGAEEVINLLKKKKEPLTTKEIARLLKVSIVAVHCTLRRLQKHGEVVAINLPKERVRNAYRGRHYAWKLK